MHCPSCRTDNPVDASFCEQCGAKLELVCPTCKTALSPGARFCKKCGTAIAATGAASAKKSDDATIRITEISPSENLEGERKTVTALFADIKGSMELIEDLDPVTLILSLGNQLWNYGARRNPAQRGDEVGWLPRPCPAAAKRSPDPFR